METGLYTITAPSGGFYVGSTSRSFARRWTEHRTELRRHRHRNSILQAAWDKYGEDAIVFAVLLRCPADECTAREREAIQSMSPPYNMALDTEAPFKGRKHSEAAKEKCRLLHLGRKRGPLSEEHKRKMSAALKGGKKPPRSDEFKAKLRAANVGKKMTQANRDAINAVIKGRKMPPRDKAWCEAISSGKLGKKIGAGNPAARMVRCVETSAVFETIKAATEWLRLNGRLKATYTNISSACVGRLKTAYGYHWVYAEPA